MQDNFSIVGKSAVDSQTLDETVQCANSIIKEQPLKFRIVHHGKKLLLWICHFCSTMATAEIRGGKKLMPTCFIVNNSEKVCMLLNEL